MTGPLHRKSVFVVGRLHGITRARLRELIRAAGGRVARDLRPSVSVVVVTHAAAAQLRNGLLPTLLFDHAGPGTEPMSETTFRRLLELAPRRAEEPREIDEDRLMALARIDEFDIYWLRLFDIITAEDGLFSFRDLVAAREVGRLLRTGMDLGEIVVGALELRRRQGLELSAARLGEGPFGLAHLVGGGTAELNGQFQLPLGMPSLTPDQVFDMAEQLEREEIWDQAERFYRIAALMDRTDPVIPFNLGNVLKECGRMEEACVAWQQALARDPSFAEAHFNLAIAAEDKGRSQEAIELYRRAVQARPDYADATYNLALLLYSTGRYSAAVPVWERYLMLDARGRWADKARRYAAICRMNGAG